mgnify:CR=1 FL=1
MTVRWQKDWLLLPWGFALHEPTATAVLADLHLGYTAARQRLGDAIPFRSVRDEMQPLRDAAARYSISQLLVAGDLFERGFDTDICRSFFDVLAECEIRFLGLVPGNHDRHVEKAGIELPLLEKGEVAGWEITHGNQPSDAPRSIAGHWHPAVIQKGRKRPCFLTRKSHLILPAFSRDAAGSDVRLNPTWQGWDRWIIDLDHVTM